MAEEARMFQQGDAPFSGKVADVFTITGQGSFVLLENTIGRPREGQRLEVVQDDTVLGNVIVSGIEKGLRLREEGVIALHFKDLSGIRLERGHVLRTAREAQRPHLGGIADVFIPRLADFTSAVGWTTLAVLAFTFVAWLLFALHVQGVAAWMPPWLELIWYSLTVAFAIILITLAAVWLTAFLWLRGLRRI